MPTRKKASRRGGRRPGAGRKRIIREPISYSVAYERRDFEALEEIAERRGVSVAEVIRMAVRTYLKRRKRR